MNTLINKIPVETITFYEPKKNLKKILKKNELL